MKKYISMLCINLAGCGKIDNSNSSSINTSLSSGMVFGDNNSTLVPDNNKQEETTDTPKEEPSCNPSQNEIPEETPANESDSDEIQIFNLSEDTPYKNTDHSIKILGLKEYKSLKSDLYEKNFWYYFWQLLIIQKKMNILMLIH